MIQFCYLRLGIETVSCRLLQRMANEKVGPTVSSFNDMSGWYVYKNNQTI